MKRLFQGIFLVFFLSSFSLAQNLNKVVFGPLEGDDAGVLTVQNGQAIEIEMWVRTDPHNPAPVWGVAHGLMSQDAIIAERNEAEIAPEYNVPYWEQVFVDGPFVHNPDDTFPIPENHTCEIQGAVYNVFDDPYPDSHPLDTGGEWDYYGAFLMTCNTGLDVDTTYYPLSQGWYPHSGQGTTWAFENPPGGTVEPEQDYCGLNFIENTDPEFTICPDSAHHVEQHQPICLEVAGTDADTLDDLHISLLSGPGTFTEEVGGPGGLASGLWCWDDPLAGDYDIVLELNDNAGGVDYCEFQLDVVPYDTTLEIETVPGFPGATVVVPIRLHTIDMKVGGLQLLIGWNDTGLTLARVIPRSRIDFGHEYFHYNSDLHGPGPDFRRAVRITWISDIDDRVAHEPASVGDERIIDLIFQTSWTMPEDITVPITFVSGDESDNMIADSSGEAWFVPDLIDGSIEFVNPFSYRKGDVNMNGYFFEIGDLLLVIRRLIHGFIIWAENGTKDDPMQEYAADVNNNGVIDISDLVTFMNIFNGIADPPYKYEPCSIKAEIGISEFQENKIVIFIDSDVEVGAVLVRMTHPGMVLGEPSAGNGMEIYHHDSGDVISLVVWSREAKRIPAGRSDLLTIPVVSNNAGVVGFGEVTASDSHGRILEITTPGDTTPPAAFALHKNYPNPFNASTTFGYDLPEGGQVTVEIFDILGRRVETLISGFQQPGSHTVVWDAGDSPSGVYFYRIQAADYTATRECLLLK